MRRSAPRKHQSRTRTAPVTEADDGGRITTWPPAFFAEFQPTNALDMILRIPGFTYERGDTGQRGLSGASGNILIDGQRPSTKSLALDDILRRIAVEDVTRIDVIRGSAPGVDMQGRPIVANIIRRAGGTSSAAVELMTKFYGDHAPARIARIEGSRARGGLSLEGAIQYRDEKDQGASGTGRLMRRDRERRADQLRRVRGGMGSPAARRQRRGGISHRPELLPPEPQRRAQP